MILFYQISHLILGYLDPRQHRPDGGFPDLTRTFLVG